MGLLIRYLIAKKIPRYKTRIEKLRQPVLGIGSVVVGVQFAGTMERGWHNEKSRSPRMAPSLSYASISAGYLPNMSLSLLSSSHSTLITLHPLSLPASVAPCRGNRSPIGFAPRSLRSSLRTATKKTVQDFAPYRSNGGTSLSPSSFGGWS